MLGGGDALARGAKSASFSVPHNYGDDPKKKGKKSKEIKVTDKRPDFSIALGKAGAAKPKVKPVAPKVKFQPMGSKVLVWRITAEEGLIALADVAVEKPLECEVIAVSTTGLNEYDSKALSLLSPGDKVLLRKNTGTEIKVDGHDLTVLHVADILGKF